MVEIKSFNKTNFKLIDCQSFPKNNAGTLRQLHYRVQQTHSTLGTKSNLLSRVKAKSETQFRAVEMHISRHFAPKNDAFPTSGSFGTATPPIIVLPLFLTSSSHMWMPFQNKFNWESKHKASF